jgi:hypothetical protein
MALISGSSLSPPDRAQAPVQLPASKHKLVHGLANNMVARRPPQSETSYPKLPARRKNGRRLGFSKLIESNKLQFRTSYEKRRTARVGDLGSAGVESRMYKLERPLYHLRV